MGVNGENNFTAQIPAGREVYFVLENAKEVTRNTRVNITANGRTKQYYFAEKGDLMYSEQRTAYLSFGYFAEATELTFNVEIDAGAEINYDAIKVFALNLSGAETAISALQTADGMQNIVIERNGVKGTLETSGGYLFLSIP